MTVPRRKLIEVALPLDAINAASVREKSIRHGHPSTLHLWWARRPLAACRAVLFAQLVDDPSSLPEEFPTEELQDAERQRLFGIIEDLVKWENSTNEEVLNAARAEILKSTDGNPPPILDPFAGGGSIPLEAQRLGLEAYASDLNPVAVLINKALIEIPPKWADMPPVHPDAEQRTHWKGAEGLAEDVRLYGKWMRDEAEQRIGHLYPKAILEDGSEANVIAWIWARTVICPNPACGATMPLASSFWLGKKKGKEAWVNPIVDTAAKTVRFEIGHGPQGPPDPPKVGRGAKFRCLVCNEISPDDYIKTEGVAGRLGEQLMAIVAEGKRKREYLTPTREHAKIARVARPESVPSGSMPDNPRWFSPPLFGFIEYSELFTDRQIESATAFFEILDEASSLVSGAASDRMGSANAADEYATALRVYLAFALSKVIDYGNAFCTWASQPKQEAVAHLFARQSIAMVWDHAEANPLASSSGSLGEAFGWVERVLRKLTPAAPGFASQSDARVLAGDRKCVIATDPPYYDNIGYSDISDFFYIWLRSAMIKSFPDLFQTILAPKSEELIATPTRHGGSKDEAERFFEKGFLDVFTTFRAVQRDSLPLTFFYAFRQSEATATDGLVSTGWSTMLEGLLQAGWSVTATWPMRTELHNKVSMGTNLLASSVVLACRPRDESAGLTDRQGLVRALHAELPDALHELQKAHIAPVDLRQAAIGPGMAVFSRYSRVVEADGEAMRVRTALGLINQVLDQVLGEQEAAFDPETRWAIQWFSQFFEDEGPYGVAETLATAMAIPVDGMVDSGILESGGGRVRLLGRDEYPDDWDPVTDLRTPVWEACQHLVKRLEDQGEAAAGELLAQLGGLGESAQLLAYRLYTICEQSRPNLAGPYNSLVASWNEVQQQATTTELASPTQQSFDD